VRRMEPRSEAPHWIGSLPSFLARSPASGSRPLVRPGGAGVLVCRLQGHDTSGLGCVRHAANCKLEQGVRVSGRLPWRWAGLKVPFPSRWMWPSACAINRCRARNALQLEESGARCAPSGGGESGVATARDATYWCAVRDGNDLVECESGNDSLGWTFASSLALPASAAAADSKTRTPIFRDLFKRGGSGTRLAT